MSTAVVYVATCDATGKSYVGKAIDRDRRWGKHLSESRKPKPTSLVARAIKAHGASSFRLQTLEEFDSEDAALEWESWWVAYLETRAPNGYNLDSGGAGGKRHCAETKAKIGVAHRGVPRSADVREKIARSLKGRPKTDEARAAIAAAARSPERRAKIAAALRGRVHSQEQTERHAAAMRGRTLTPEHIEKCAAALRGRRHSDETRAKIGAAQRGRAHSPEQTAHHAASMRGRKLTAEHKAKISAGLNAFHAANEPGT